jgi:hypothetical protein
LDLWALRDLSLIGKITILKSLAFSTLTYQCGILNPPDKFIDTIKDIAFTFLWNNGPEKVKRKTIIADYKDGGLKMLDFDSFLSAQKVMWVKRLYTGKMANWKAYPNYIFDKILGKNSFRCNIDIKKKTKMDPFYWSILKNWTVANKKKSDMDVFDVRTECLWMNKDIKIAKAPFKWKNWIEKDIITIHDIVNDEGSFLTVQEINRQFDFTCNVLQYNQIKDAIPKEWRNKLKTMNVPKNTLQRDENLYIQMSKQTLPINL